MMTEIQGIDGTYLAFGCVSRRAECSKPVSREALTSKTLRPLREFQQRSDGASSGIIIVIGELLLEIMDARAAIQECGIG